MQKAEAKNKLQEYLENLWYLVINLERYLRAVRTIDANYFDRKEYPLLDPFRHFRYLLVFNVVVKVSALFDRSMKAKRSLHWYLKQASTNAACITETPNLLQDRIREDNREIESLKDDLERIKTWRDKSYTHFDKKYFDDPSRLHDEYPLAIDVLENIVTFLKNLVSSHCGFIERVGLHWPEDDLGVQSVLSRLEEWSQIEGYGQRLVNKIAP